MLRFVVRRVATSILLLVATSALVFFTPRLLPGDPVITSLGASPGVSPETIDRLRHEAGIDRPIVEQYVSWLTAAFHGDLGNSYFSQFPVSSLIKTRLMPTLELTFLGVLLSVVLAVPGALWQLVIRADWSTRDWMPFGRCPSRFPRSSSASF